VKADIEARPMRVFGKRVVPNLVRLARHQERVALRNKLIPLKNPSSLFESFGRRGRLQAD
jgi:hypothetical protein